MTTANTNQQHQSTTGPVHTNRLIHATSPYLLQHAHNPVDWYEWGPEALERAKKEDKPIFLSIGYSACHWCHVMERESFEDEAIAAIMNQHYVCIKVDREERPDLDDIYMAATQAFTQSGGWPMSVWLTPDLKPFFAGTYFPPEARYGRPGFREILLTLKQVWEEDRDKALRQADVLTDAVRQLTVSEGAARELPRDLVVRSARMLARVFDPQQGGMLGGGTNKFPPSMAMDVMLRAYQQSMSELHRLEAGATGQAGATGGASSTPHRQDASATQAGATPAGAAPQQLEADAALLELVEVTLERMANGGIYDQLGGGFARYSTDAEWLVPHFEKMLYDQALIVDIYLKAYQLTRKPLYARVARETLDYVLRDLQSPDGGFCSSRDADSEGQEGKFYVWSKAEVVGILGEDDAQLFCDYYDVTEAGNWDGRNILHVPRPLETVAESLKMTPAELERRLGPARQRLFDAREKRVKPHLDDKVLASWNGLMIATLAKGYRILGDSRYSDAAVRAADFLQHNMMKDGRLLRAYRAGKARTPGYLDDHAFVIEGLLNLYEATFDAKWVAQAEALNEQVLRHFRDEQGRGFFNTADDAEKLLVRARDASDGAIPSGNSVEAMNLLRLAVLLDRNDLAEEADKLLRAFGAQLAESAFQSERLLAAADFRIRGPKEIALVGTAGAMGQFERLVSAVWQAYVPNAVIAGAVVGDKGTADAPGRIPLLAGKQPLNGGAAAYVCRNYACQEPTSDPDRLREQIAR